MKNKKNIKIFALILFFMISISVNANVRAYNEKDFNILGEKNPDITPFYFDKVNDDFYKATYGSNNWSFYIDKKDINYILFDKTSYSNGYQYDKLLLLEMSGAQFGTSDFFRRWTFKSDITENREYSKKVDYLLTYRNGKKWNQYTILNINNFQVENTSVIKKFVAFNSLNGFLNYNLSDAPYGESTSANPTFYLFGLKNGVWDLLLIDWPSGYNPDSDYNSGSDKWYISLYNFYGNYENVINNIIYSSRPIYNFTDKKYIENFERVEKREITYSYKKVKNNDFYDIEFSITGLKKGDNIFLGNYDNDNKKYFQEFNIISNTENPNATFVFNNVSKNAIIDIIIKDKNGNILKSECVKIDIDIFEDLKKGNLSDFFSYVNNFINNKINKPIKKIMGTFQLLFDNLDSNLQISIIVIFLIVLLFTLFRFLL